MPSCPQLTQEDRDLDIISAQLSPACEKKLRKIVKAKNERAKFKHEGWKACASALKEEKKRRQKIEAELAPVMAKAADDERKWQSQEVSKLEEAHQQLEEETNKRKELEGQVQLLLTAIRQSVHKKSKMIPQTNPA